jgi:hypothetical protein
MMKLRHEAYRTRVHRQKTVTRIRAAVYPTICSIAPTHLHARTRIIAKSSFHIAVAFTK